jgi:hypothetical protein
VQDVVDRVEAAFRVVHKMDDASLLLATVVPRDDQPGVELEGQGSDLEREKTEKADLLDFLERDDDAFRRAVADAERAFLEVEVDVGGSGLIVGFLGSVNPTESEVSREEPQEGEKDADGPPPPIGRQLVAPGLGVGGDEGDDEGDEKRHAHVIDEPEVFPVADDDSAEGDGIPLFDGDSRRRDAVISRPIDVSIFVRHFTVWRRNPANGRSSRVRNHCRRRPCRPLHRP